MFCNKCGAQIPDNTKFCANCGAAVNQPEVQKPVEDITTKPKKAKVKLNKKVIIPVVSVVLAIVVAGTSLAVFGDEIFGKKVSDTEATKTKTTENAETNDVEDEVVVENNKDKYYLVKKITTNEENDTTTEIYYADGEIASLVSEQNGVVYSRKIQDRDDQGRVIKMGLYYEDSQVEYAFSEYTEQNGVFVATAEAFDNGATRKYEYAYDSDGLVYIKEYTEGKLVLLTEFNGNIETISEYDDDTLVEKTIKEYDKNGNIVRYEYSSIELYGSFLNVCTYDKKGNLVEVKMFDHDGKLIEKEVYEYDKNGNRTSVKQYDENNELEQEITSKYNEYGICVEESNILRGHLITSITFKSQSSDKVVVEQYHHGEERGTRYEYTVENGKVIEYTGYDSQTGEQTVYVKYNEYGLVAERTYYYGANDFSKTTFEYAEIK